MSEQPKTWECWVAYYNDYSGITVFSTEIEALRHAVNHGMAVTSLKSGEDLR